MNKFKSESYNMFERIREFKNVSRNLGSVKVLL